MTAPVERALVVVAHPDDIDFGAAGTVATWVEQGIEVTYCLVTDGDAGGFDDTPRERMAGLRREEQTAAAGQLGVTDLRFLGRPDGRLYVNHELRRDISRVIREVRPQRVLTQSPERVWDRLPASHPDHLATPARRPRSRCTPTPATRSPIPSCSPTASRRGPCASFG